MGMFNQPKAADPTTVANTQAQYNKQASTDYAKMLGQMSNKTGPFGATTTQVDANGIPTGQTQTLDPSLNAGTAADKFGATVNNLGTGQFNWDTMTPQAIAQGNMDAYSAMTMPMREQQQKVLKTTLAERGLPLGSEIEQDLQGNMDRQFAVADQNAAAQAWNAVPGMQAQMTNTAVQQEMAPGQVAGQNLGLLSGLQNMAPQYANLQPQSIAPGNFAGAQANYDQVQQQNYANNMAGLGSLLKIGGGIVGGPVGTAALGGLFGNGSSTSPGTYANGGWSTTTTPNNSLFNWFG